MTAWTVEPGVRVIAIGDLHGRRDLLLRMCDAIAELGRDRGPARVRVVCVGDYVDRGADSRGVIETLLDPPPVADEWTCLMGNHEDLLLRTLDGDVSAAVSLLENGGRATALSYGVRLPLATGASAARALTDGLRAAMPPDHVAFLRRLKLSTTIGDYFFCHAGARPGVDLDRQSARDLLWIRESFLGSAETFSRCVVHGHTPDERVRILPNRINVDLGAYATNRLGAAALEGDRRDPIVVAS